MEIKKVALANILFSDIALRSHKATEDHIVELAIDICNRGLLNLLTLVPNANEEGTYIVSDGARRMTALKLIKAGTNPLVKGPYADIPDEMSFQVHDVQSELDTLADQIAGNAQIKQTMKKSYIDGLHRIVSSGTMDVDTLGAKIGMTPEYIWKLFKTLRLGDELLKRAEEDGVSITNLITFAKNLAGKLDEDGMTEWYEFAKDSTVKEFAKLVEKKVDAVAKEAKGQPRVEPTFELTPKLLSKDELTMLLTQATAAFAEDASPVNQARLIALQEIWQIDEVTAQQREAAWLANQDDKKAKAAIRKEARENAKLTDSIPKLEKEGYKVVAPQA